MEKAGLSFAPIRKPQDLYDDEHLLATGRLADIRLPEGPKARRPEGPKAGEAVLRSGHRSSRTCTQVSALTSGDAIVGTPCAQDVACVFLVQCHLHAGVCRHEALQPLG